MDLERLDALRARALQPEDEPPVTGDAEEMLEELSLQHRYGVVRLPSRSLPVIETLE